MKVELVGEILGGSEFGEHFGGPVVVETVGRKVVNDGARCADGGTESVAEYGRAR